MLYRLKHKQNLYPVVFCTCGEDAYTTYNPWESIDIRTRTRMIGAHLCQIYNFDVCYFYRVAPVNSFILRAFTLGF